jgi:hypothetical protein
VATSTIETLQSEIRDLHDRYPALTDDNLFVLWFLHAYLVDEEETAARALAGGANDKGVDAVLVDESSESVFVIQGKFRTKVGAKSEDRTDVTSFASMADVLLGEPEKFREFIHGIDPLVEERLRGARKRLTRKNNPYQLQLLYVTLGRVSDGLRQESGQMVRRVGPTASMTLLDGKQILGLLDDYLDGVAPPVRSLDLPIETGGRVASSGVITRFDPTSEIESWVFSIRGSDIGDLFERTGKRLFARNIRGFLGDTKINRAMEDTLRSRPHYFWYFNNGVTMVCDSAQKIQERGREVLRLQNPQVINGQQTTRVLAALDAFSPKASVLVRVIRIPRDAQGASSRFDALVSQIVEATNWQNFIKASDLVANDRRQVLIEREFRKRNYQYLRKRQSKREARASARSKHRFLIKKEDLAQAVAACRLDPAIVRAGKEALFEEPFYSAVFESGAADFYLTRYWLMRRVSSAARGYPERAYAKWLVLNFLWDRLGRDVERKSDAFIQSCQSPNLHPRVIDPLERVINGAFKGALTFFRRNRGQGPQALDVSTFFQRRNLHTEFAKFWGSVENRHRGPFERAAARFISALKD